MNNRQLVRFFVCVLALAGPVAAQSNDSVDPDRPDVTNGTHVVPGGLAQIEFGGMYTRATQAQTGVTTPFTVRIGLADWVEARFGADGLTAQRGPEANGTGFGNVQLGAKLRLWGQRGGEPVLSILPGVTLPTADAARGLGSGDADYTVALLTGRDISTRGHIDINYGIGAIGDGQGRTHYVQHLVSASASAAVTDRWNPYLEVFWLSRTDIDGAAQTALDTGVIYQLGSRVAVDGGVLFGIGGPAPDFGAFGGLTLIVGSTRTHSVHRPTARAPTVHTQRRTVGIIPGSAGHPASRSDVRVQ